MNYFITLTDTLYFQIRTDVQTDRQIHNLETELSKLRMLHDEGKAKLRILEREVQQYQTVSMKIIMTVRDFTEKTKPCTSYTDAQTGQVLEFFYFSQLFSFSFH